MSIATVHQSGHSPSAKADGLASFKVKRLWHAECPAAIRDAWKAGDNDQAWQLWQKHLLSQQGAGIDRHYQGRGKKTPPLAWGLPGEDAGQLAAWIKSAFYGKKGSEAAAEQWLNGVEDPQSDLHFALQAVGWATRLRSLAEGLSPATWWRLADALLGIVEEATAAAAPDAAEAEATVVTQLLTGELPLVLSRELPELKPIRDLVPVAKAALSDGLERLTDGEGLLAGTLWADPSAQAASLLLASWTRCRMATEEAKPPWTGDAQTQYEWLVRQAIRLSDRNGRLAFTSDDTAGTAELIREAIRQGGDDSDRDAAALRLKGFRSGGDTDTPMPSNHSEWSELGVLAAGWRDKAPRIVVAHPADTMRIEVRAGKQTLLAGDWPVEASMSGEPIRSTGDWDVQCWYSDDDCDYLELALPLVTGARLERQFFLSREDGVGFLAETLFSEQADPQELTITSRLPLGESIGLRPSKETREAVLSAGGEPVAGVVPLALAEWRDDPRGGELTAEQRQLVLTRHWTGRNAVSPLWIDFSAKRFEKQRTWRQLAVAESLKNVSHDVAVGYRVQSNKEQWLVYRSLDKAGNRTVMGQNYSSEQVVGMFNPDTHLVDEYFEIEADS